MQNSDSKRAAHPHLPLRALMGAIAGCVLVLAAGGCSPKGAASALPYAPPAPPGTPFATRVEDLPTERNADFRLAVPFQSLAAVEYYDRELARLGWKKAPVEFQQAGQRQWIAISVSEGPTSAYDAKWRDPKTGRVALLGMWYRSGDQSTQYGTFELFPPGQGL